MDFKQAVEKKSSLPSEKNLLRIMQHMFERKIKKDIKRKIRSILKKIQFWEKEINLLIPNYLRPDQWQKKAFPRYWQQEVASIYWCKFFILLCYWAKLTCVLYTSCLMSVMYFKVRAPNITFYFVCRLFFLALCT